MTKYFLVLIVLTISSAPAQNKADSTQIFVDEIIGRLKGKQNESSEKVFKNIQTLKGMPADRLLKIMEFGFNKSLGVGCQHCHNPQAWESDEKDKKDIARRMWQMAENIRKELPAITKKQSVVNCNTCHRGEIKPSL